MNIDGRIRGTFLGLLGLNLVGLALGIILVSGAGHAAPVAPKPNPVVAQEAPRGLRVPPGFAIEVYTAQVPGARSLALSPDGTLFIGTRHEGKVYAVVDRDGDFQADHVYTLASGLTMPNGVAFRDGDLYVAEVSRVLRFPGIEASLANPPAPTVIAADYPRESAHGWKFIAFGPDGHLYVPVGAPCNICRPDPDTYAVITQLDVTTGEHQVFARGIRNTVGFDWHPRTGELWFTDNGRDWLGDNRPPDELNRAGRPGLHFGYPFCHGRDLADPKFGGQRACQRFTPPALELGAHVAALGMRFYTGEQFPARYRGGIFIAEHGSWNRQIPTGYRVMFVPMQDGEPRSAEVFAAGWLKEGVPTGRPVDLLVMPDGSLLVSDDQGGRVYRIYYAG